MFSKKSATGQRRRARGIWVVLLMAAIWVAVAGWLVSSPAQASILRCGGLMWDGGGDGFRFSDAANWVGDVGPDSTTPVCILRQDAGDTWLTGDVRVGSIETDANLNSVRTAGTDNSIFENTTLPRTMDVTNVIIGPGVQSHPLGTSITASRRLFTLPDDGEGPGRITIAYDFVQNYHFSVGSLELNVDPGVTYVWERGDLKFWRLNLFGDLITPTENAWARGFDYDLRWSSGTNLTTQSRMKEIGEGGLRLYGSVVKSGPGTVWFDASTVQYPSSELVLTDGDTLFAREWQFHGTTTLTEGARLEFFDSTSDDTENSDFATYGELSETGRIEGPGALEFQRGVTRIELNDQDGFPRGTYGLSSQHLYDRPYNDAYLRGLVNVPTIATQMLNSAGLPDPVFAYQVTRVHFDVAPVGLDVLSTDYSPVSVGGSTADPILRPRLFYSHADIQGTGAVAPREQFTHTGNFALNAQLIIGAGVVGSIDTALKAPAERPMIVEGDLYLGNGPALTVDTRMGYVDVRTTGSLIQAASTSSKWLQFAHLKNRGYVRFDEGNNVTIDELDNAGGTLIGRAGTTIGVGSSSSPVVTLDGTIDAELIERNAGATLLDVVGTFYVRNLDSVVTEISIAADATVGPFNTLKTAVLTTEQDIEVRERLALGGGGAVRGTGRIHAVAPALVTLGLASFLLDAPIDLDEGTTFYAISPSSASAGAQITENGELNVGGDAYIGTVFSNTWTGRSNDTLAGPGAINVLPTGRLIAMNPDAQSGYPVAFPSDARWATRLHVPINNAGTIEVPTGGSLGTSGAVVNSGEVTIATSFSAGSYVQNSGTTTLNGGHMTLYYSDLVLNGGQLGGSGVIDADISVDRGTIGLPDIADALVLSSGFRPGNIQFSEFATFDVEVRDGGASDHLTVEGVATLGGEVRVGAAPGATVSSGSHRFLDAPNRLGVFDTVTDTDPADDYRFSVSYDALGALVDYLVARPDVIAPEVTLDYPADGAVFALGDPVAPVSATCTDTGEPDSPATGVASCTWNEIDASTTTAAGLRVITAVGVDGAGNTTTVEHRYFVVDLEVSDPAPVVGDIVTVAVAGIGDADVSTLRVDFGDGASGLTSGPSLQHQWSKFGTFPLRATLTTTDGTVKVLTGEVTVAPDPADATDLAAGIAVSTAKAAKGSLNATIAATVQNLGAVDAENVVVTFALPAEPDGTRNGTVLSVSPGCTADPAAWTVTCSFALIPAGSEASANVVINGKFTSTMRTSVQVESLTNLDPDLGNNLAEAAVVAGKGGGKGGKGGGNPNN